MSVFVHQFPPCFVSGNEKPCPVIDTDNTDQQTLSFISNFLHCSISKGFTHLSFCSKSLTLIYYRRLTALAQRTMLNPHYSIGSFSKKQQYRAFPAYDTLYKKQTHFDSISIVTKLSEQVMTNEM